MPITQTVTSKPSPFVISTFSEECLGDVLTTNRATAAANTNPTVNKAFFYPFYLSETRTFYGMLWENGATAAGNVNTAVYNTDGSVFPGSTVGSAVQTGASVVQKKAFSSPITIPAGWYFLAFCSSDGTATFARSSLSVGMERAAGVRELGAFFALTASAAAWVGTTNTFIPMVGIYEASWL